MSRPFRSSMIALLAVMCGTLATPAHAEFKTGNDIKIGLEGWMDKQSTEYIRDGMAFGYVIGVHDALSGTLICSGENVTQGQVVEIVLKFMRNNPEVLDKSADVIVLAALKSVWPCADT